MPVAPSREAWITPRVLSRQACFIGIFLSTQSSPLIVRGRFLLPMRTIANIVAVRSPVMMRMAMNEAWPRAEVYARIESVAMPTIASRSSIRSTATLDRLGKKPMPSLASMMYALATSPPNLTGMKELTAYPIMFVQNTFLSEGSFRMAPSMILQRIDLRRWKMRMEARNQAMERGGILEACVTTFEGSTKYTRRRKTAKPIPRYTKGLLLMFRP